MRYGNDDFVPVMLGTNLNTYNQARSLHEAFGIRSLALGRFPLRETTRSAIVDVRANPRFDTPEVIVSTLQDLARELPGRKRLLLPNIEFYAGVVLEHRAELEQDYLIPLVDASLAARLMNKRDFARTCAELGVPHPGTVVAGAADVEADTFGTDLPFAYPVICKPADTDTYPRLRFEGKQKVYLVQDAAELRAITRRIYAAGYGDDLIVQEYIPGDETVMRVANSYSDRHGQMRFLSVAQVALAEPDPNLVGNYNAVLTVHDEELTESIRRLLDGVGYVGPANFDVMVDPRDGLAKILEINLRQGACSYFTMAAGGNLTRCYVDDLVHETELTEQVTTAERLWVNAPYPVVSRFAPAAMRPRLRAAAKHGVTHTLHYAGDRGVRRRLEVARIDLRHTLDYVRHSATRFNR
ncbi:carboxylate--amine ligase [Cellulomonas soli]